MLCRRRAERRRASCASPRKHLGETAERPVVESLALRPPAHWSDYVFGVAQQLVRAGFPVEPKNLLIHSTVPVGSGLSSSAALETSTALALLGSRSMDRLELVKLCRRAENEFVGMPCGIMDQYISVFGREGSAVRIDCRSLANEAVQLPAGAAIFAVNTMVKHELGASAYRERVRECREAVEAIRPCRAGNREPSRCGCGAFRARCRRASRRSRAGARSMS